MEDTELRSAYCAKLHAMCHFKIEDNNLVITVDYDSKGFAEWEYLRLTDPNYEDTMKMLASEGKTFTEWVRENFRVEYV